MLRIITANLNGIRSAAKKGFFKWLEDMQPDILCIQELKAQEADLDDLLLCPGNYKGHFQYAEKKGYSGVGVYTRHEPSDVIIGFDGGEFDAERLLDFLSSYVDSMRDRDLSRARPAAPLPSWNGPCRRRSRGRPGGRSR